MTARADLPCLPPLPCLLAEVFPKSIPITGAMLEAKAPVMKAREPGAYALLLTLGSPTRFGHKGGTEMLGTGCYVYAGSAHGPGGIAARLRRHFRADKKPHWHVDRLTLAAAQIAAIAIPGGSECEIIARLEGLPSFRHPISGFGSSDCAACRSHLLHHDPAVKA